MASDAETLVLMLGLEPHPEGGYYRELYRSDEQIPAAGLPGRYEGPRACSTGIYYLLRTGDRSRLHRVRSDELWHYYDGDPVTLHVLHEDGSHQRIILGPPPEGEGWQIAVRHDVWFGAETEGPAGYALVGCTVAPGFDYADFELADPDALLARFPQHAELIRRLS